VRAWVGVRTVPRSSGGIFWAVWAMGRAFCGNKREGKI